MREFHADREPILLAWCFKPLWLLAVSKWPILNILCKYAKKTLALKEADQSNFYMLLAGGL
jgi:hypothetical protein